MDTFTLSYAFLWTLVIVQGIAIIVLLRTVGSLFLGSRDAIERDGLVVGTNVPSVTMSRSNGGLLTTEELRGRWSALIFAAPACQICRELLPTLPDLQLDLAGEADVYVVVRGTTEDARLMAASTAGVDIVAMPDELARGKFKVRVSPFVHVVAPDGRIAAKGLVNSRQDVEHLLASGGLEHPVLTGHSHAHMQAEG